MKQPTFIFIMQVILSAKQAAVLNHLWNYNVGFSLGGTCNHIAAILFKVDFQWKKGLTAFSKTSRECEWDCYGASRSIEPKPVKDMVFKKPHYTKGGKIISLIQFISPKE